MTPESVNEDYIRAMSLRDEVCEYISNITGYYWFDGVHNSAPQISYLGANCNKIPGLNALEVNFSTVGQSNGEFVGERHSFESEELYNLVYSYFPVNDMSVVVNKDHIQIGNVNKVTRVINKLVEEYSTNGPVEVYYGDAILNISGDNDDALMAIFVDCAIKVKSTHETLDLPYLTYQLGNSSATISKDQVQDLKLDTPNLVGYYISYDNLIPLIEA